MGEKMLFELACTVFLPNGLVEGLVVEDLKAKIDAEDDRIFVSLSESDDAGLDSQGRTVDVLVLYLNETARDVLHDEWSASFRNGTGWFGNGSVMQAVSARDVNESVQYHGSEVYEEHGDHDERDT